MSLKANRQQWFSKYHMLFATVVGAFSILFALFFPVYWQARIEEKVVADLLSKSPNGEADVTLATTWRCRLCDLLRISRPVCDLTLKGSEINDNDLVKLQSLKSLEILTLVECPITDDGVREIAKVRTLTGLCLWGGNGLTDASLTYIQKMQSLADLCLMDSEITGQGIQKLSALQNLSHLDLNGCFNLSDDAVKPLTSLTGLNQLDIRYISISKEGVREIERALPNTVIFADY